MATKKVKVPSSWNAKPVTRVGGGSGGVRKPSSPYSSVKRPLPSSERLPLTPKPKSTAKPAAKTKIELLREAAKTKPKSPAPRPKTKIELLRGAAKTKPKSPAPRGTATPKPTAKPVAKPTAKPNSKASAPPSNNRPGARPTMPNSSRAGINLPRAAVNALPKPIGPTTKGMTPTSVATGAAKATVKGVASKALMLPAIAAQIADIKGGFETLASHPLLKGKGGNSGSGTTSANSSGSRRTGQNSSNVQYPQGTPSGAGSRRGAAPVAGGGSKPKKPARPASDYEKLFQTGGGRANYGLDKKDDPDRKREPVAPLPVSVRKPNSSSSGSSTPSRGSSTKSRSSSSSSSASPSTSTSGTPAKPGQKWSDFNPGRGTSKTNNPLMKDMIKRMKDREDKEQASKAQQLTDKSRQNSGYSSAEKVDGSKYADELKKKKGYNSSVSQRLRHPSNY
jgi:hypothetical protein